MFLYLSDEIGQLAHVSLRLTRSGSARSCDSRSCRGRRFPCNDETSDSSVSPSHKRWRWRPLPMHIASRDAVGTSLRLTLFLDQLRIVELPAADLVVE